jgi:hypothetical protein
LAYIGWRVQKGLFWRVMLPTSVAVELKISIWDQKAHEGRNEEMRMRRCV